MGERHPSMKMLERLAAILKVTGRTLLPAKRLRGPDPDATAQAHLFKFDAELLFRVDEKSSLPLARLMMATDDIRHLRKLLIVQHEPSDATPSEKALVEGEVGHLFRLLCSHLFEAMGAFADLDDTCHGLLDDSVRTPQSAEEQVRASAALRTVRSERAKVLANKGRRHFIAIVRNLVGFHYPDDQKLRRTLAKHLWQCGSSDRLAGRLVASTLQGIGRYAVSDDILKLMIRDEVGGRSEDFARKYMEAIEQALDLVQALIDVVDFLIAHFVTVRWIRTEAAPDIIRIHPRIVQEHRRLVRERMRT